MQKIALTRATRPVSFSVSDLAARVSGEIFGDPTLLIKNLGPLEYVTKNMLVFSRKVTIKSSLTILQSSSPCAILISKLPPEEERNLVPSVTYIVVKDSQRAMIELTPLFFPELVPSGEISSKADIHSSVKIGDSVSIGAFTSIAHDVEIADEVVIHPHVVIYPHVKIGKGSVIHSGAVIREYCIVGAACIIHNGAIVGADGFGYIPDPVVGLRKVPQVGGAVIGDQVEIGANSCVDRGTLGDTHIGLGSKLDNLVQVGHNTRIGKYVILCGHVGIAGSCDLADGTVIGGHVGIADHVRIVPKVRVGGKSGVIASLLQSGDYAGYPATPAAEWRQQGAALRRLPEFLKQQRRKKETNDEENS